MKKLTPILIMMCFAATSVSQTQPASCTKFHRGKFSYITPSKEVVTLSRTSKKQTEKNETTGVVTVWRVKWLSDCSYELSQKWSSDKLQRKKYGMKSTIIITGVTSHSYEYSCVCAGQQKTETNTMRVLN
ncbi:MAG: hypothetical protein JWQ27_528 [Ferruginibacter sp.]|nr:hypothetical protein [Ferruginibacter sp.]